MRKVVDAKTRDSDSGPDTATEAAPWNRRRVITGTRLFVGFTLAALLFLFARGNFGAQLRLLFSLSPLFLGIGLAQTVLDFFGGGFRLWFLSRAFGERIRFSTCVRANGTNIFVGGVTPSQTGGGPAQIYLMAREGTSYPVAMATSLIAYLGTIAVLVGGGAVIMLGAPLHTVGQEFRLFSSVAVGALLLLLLAFLPFILKPDAGARVLRRVVHRLPIVGRKLADNGPLARLESTARDFSTLMHEAWRHQKLRVLGGIIITVLIYLNKFLVAYVVMRGLGLTVNVWHVLYLQWVSYLVIYFAPTPGAGGLAEIAGAGIMQSILPGSHAGAFVLLWRAFSLYIPMLLGGTYLLRGLLQAERGGGKRRRPPGGSAEFVSSPEEVSRSLAAGLSSVEPR